MGRLWRILKAAVLAPQIGARLLPQCMSPTVAHHVISVWCGIWSLSGHSGHGRTERSAALITRSLRSGDRIELLVCCAA
jgi:hypothetical protein